jgi:hypothetical protein
MSTMQYACSDRTAKQTKNPRAGSEPRAKGQEEPELGADCDSHHRSTLEYNAHDARSFGRRPPLLASWVAASG